MTQPSAFLLDIEGTTTPIDFVTRTLFPFARAHMASYLEQHGSEPETLNDLASLATEHANESEAPSWPDRPSARDALTYIEWLMDRDRKSPGLKGLQGRIWEQGYASGDLAGEVYPDVGPAIARWRARGATVQIYSSGSELAQRLLFGSLADRAISNSISGYYDTQYGSKRESASYSKIVASMGADPGRTLFLSDIVEEVRAALEAGLQAVEVRRDGKPGSIGGWVRDFDSIT